MGYSAEDLTVVIPTRERWPVLERTLAALRDQTVTGFDVVVVQDGDDPSAPAGLAGARLLREDKGGPGRARNAGTRATERRLVLFLGDDIIPVPHLVARHLEAHDRHPERESAVLGLSVWHPELTRNRVMRWMESSGVQFDYDGIRGEDAGWGRFYSSNASLKRDFFLDVGGFDQEFEYDYEDLDFAFRAHEKGLKLWFERDAVGRHLHEYDLDRLRRRYGSHAVGERMMCRKHPWFEPFFFERVRGAAALPAVSPAWPVINDLINDLVGDRGPQRLARLRDKARERTTQWFNQQVADDFLGGWETQEDLEELQAYLGDDFDRDLLHGHRRAVDEEMERIGDEAAFYRQSRTYLYDLTAFAAWDTKQPYRRALQRAVPPGSRLLDYGCGIGSDGLRLTRRGYQVEFADFANPSTEYLRWRLARRGIDAPVYDLDGEVPGGFDAAFSFDVIEHVDDPIGFLEGLERRARIVCVNLLEDDDHDTDLHKPLPVEAIVHRAAGRGILHYRVYHERSHLLIYRSEPQAGASGRARRARGRVQSARSSRAVRAARSPQPGS